VAVSITPPVSGEQHAATPRVATGTTAFGMPPSWQTY